MNCEKKLNAYRKRLQGQYNNGNGMVVILCWWAESKMFFVLITNKMRDQEALGCQIPDSFLNPS